ncbi:MAG: efflux RND transporter permease subunit [Duodenibacillus sp.]|nr:efflux RND transporter permease subunit [Duodenibacillus sp.]
MLSRFFVGRPIFAWVIAIVIMLAGALSIFTLPVAQYPNIAPPKVTISATYPGASAETLSRTTTQVIEQEMTGLDGLLYMSSNSDSTGSMTIELTFEAGTDPDIAQVQVQNKLSGAEPRLPDVVRQLGVTVDKSAASFLMVVGFIDNSGRLNSGDLGDFLTNNIKEPIARVTGVGQCTVFGASYGMRIWMDPGLLMKYSLEPADVINAIKAQNVQVAGGEISGQPTNGKRMVGATIRASNLLNTTEQFENIVLKSPADGATVRIKDIGYVELGQEIYTFNGRYNGKQSSGIAIELSADANALATAERVLKRIDELSPFFPEGVETVVPFDTTPFVRAAIHEVVKTLFEAIILVVAVMFLFLQNWRATIIPTIAVPVVLLGTFAVLSLLGYSINVLTMFAMVLAIGLLVDDAIVVVENVERVMTEEKCDPKTATIKSMNQITGALIGIAMVLSAVFVPMAFFGGSTGVIYRQFSVTIVAAMVLSVVVALTLTPALCGSMLKQVDTDHERASKGFFGWFNRTFDALTNGVRSSVKIFVRRMLRLMAVYLVLCGAVVFGFIKMPSAFMPSEDQGVLLMMTQTPPGATAERTDDVLARFQQTVAKMEGKAVASVFTVRGFSFAGTGQNNAMGFLRLKDWSERTTPDTSITSVMMRTMGALFSPQFKDSQGFVFPLPAVPELGVAEGFDFYLQDRSAQGHEKLMEVAHQFLRVANQDKRLVQVRLNGMEDAPMLQVNVDFDKARALGVSQAQINAVLNTAFGSSYVNDFMDRGRLKKVYVQGVEDSRATIADLDKWHVRTSSGKMMPFSAIASTEWTYGPPRLDRFNAIDAVNIQGSAAQGISSGTAMKIIEEILETMPPGYSIEWNGVSYQERVAGSNAAPLYALSILVVFLALAALYESWSIPVAVLMVIPLGVLGALGLTWITGKENDVYFQVGLLTTIGLVAKNAILIVEFARDLVDSGMEDLAAVVEAVRLRLRPILMTSLAFGLGVLPLAMATGAGAGAQSAIGVAVLGGMITGTFLCIFFVPAFYVLIIRIFGKKKPAAVKVQNNEEIEHA